MKEGTEKPVSDPSSVLCKQPKSCRKLLAERGLKTKSEVDFATHIQFSLNSYTRKLTFLTSPDFIFFLNFVLIMTKF